MSLRGRALAVVPVMAAATALVPTLAPASLHGRPRCGPPNHGHVYTLVRSHRARVFSDHGDVRGCLHGHRHSWSLTPRLHGDWTSSDTESFAKLVFSQRLVGYLYFYWHAEQEVCFARVRVLDLKTGRLRRSLLPGKRHYPGADGPYGRPPCGPNPERIVMKRNASIAWLTVERRSTEPTWFRVIRVDSRGRKTLDEGTAIDAESLRRRGSTITWRSGGVRRSARLH